MATSAGYDTFISYRKADEAIVLKIVDSLRLRVRPYMDSREVLPGHSFPAELEKIIAEVDSAVLFISLSGVQGWQRTEYDALHARHHRRPIQIVPVLLPGVHEIPAELGFLMPRHAVCFSGPDDPKALAQLIEVILAARKAPSILPAEPPAAKFQIDRLQRPGNNLFGRASVAQDITAALQDPQIGVLGIVANGGFGKTSVVYEWLAKLDPAAHGLSHVYAWPFFDRERHEETTSDAFFMETSKFFGGDAMPADSSAAEFRADYLVKEYLATRKILILDGLEVLQSPDDGSFGEVLDHGIGAFLDGLTNHSMDHANRLVIVTSRASLKRSLRINPGYKEIPLNALEPADGAALLRDLDVKGEDSELMEASRELYGHCMCLVLLGRLIANHFPDQHIDNKSTVIEEKFGGVVEFPADEPFREHISRIISYYDRLVQGGPERILLQLMALFHRPMSEAERHYLVSNARVAQRLSDQDLVLAAQRLAAYGLLVPEDGMEPVGHRDSWDCHPLVREYFRKALREQHPVEWMDAHEVLFAYFRDSAPDRPNDARQMLPLYRAIHHGCEAHRFVEALNVYRGRMLHGDAEGYATNFLGLVNEDVAALSRFFRVRADPRDSLSAEDYRFLRGRLAFSLSHCGRLEEAIDWRLLEREDFEHSADSLNAASACEQVSSLYLMAGRVVEALGAARAALEHAFKIDGDWGQKMRAHCRLGAVMFIKGDLEECRKAFGEAEEWQQREPGRPNVHSDYGIYYRYYRFETAASQVEYERFLRDAEGALALDGNWLLPRGFDNMFKALALWKLGNEGAASGLFEEARRQLKESGDIVYLPSFFLAEAEFELGRGRRERAIPCIVEAERLSRTYRLPLLEFDCALVRARVLVEERNAQAAHHAVQRLERDIDSGNYWLRSLELEMLQGDLAVLEHRKDEAESHYRHARKMIEQSGRARHKERCDAALSGIS
jgi:tetratricopeptide (TPR) repeat protein